MYDVLKPRFRVDEPVYLKMTGYKVPGYVTDIMECTDNKGKHFEYRVKDEQGYQLHGECSCIIDVDLVERWEQKV